MQRAGAILAGLVGALGAAPALAAPAQYDIAFVSEFADACVPQRLSYEGTKQTALGAGWAEVQRAANAELDAMMAISEAAAADPELAAEFSYALYQKPIEGKPHFLVVSRTSAEIQPGDRMTLVGCYLYDFDAAQVIDPEPVTALIGNAIANSQTDMHVSGYVWGPPPAMARTMDTYLTFIPEVSQYKGEAGFSGLVLSFSTSEPDAKESQS